MFILSDGEAQYEDRRFEEVEIPVPWGHVAGKWYGDRSKQPVLAMHGWQDNAGTFDRLVPLLPQYISVLCIDLPGKKLLWVRSESILMTFLYSLY